MINKFIALISKFDNLIEFRLHFFCIKFILYFKNGFMLLNDPVVNWFFLNINKNYNLIDIGANRGTYSYIFYILTKNHGKVISFEPNPRIYRILSRNIKNKVTLFNIALSNTIGIEKFYVHIEGAGPTSSLNYHEVLNDNNLINTTNVEVDTLDNFLINKNFIPNIIKIDVEGHEPQLIEGSRNTIIKYKPIIIFELIVGLAKGEAFICMIAFLREYYILNVLENDINFDDLYIDSLANNELDFRITKNYNIICTPISYGN